MTAVREEQAGTAGVDPRFAQPARLGFVVGGQKCGTNWVHRYLTDHPDACVPLLKETGYWTTIRPPFRKSQRLKKEAQRLAAKGRLRRLATWITQRQFQRTLAMAGRFAEGDDGGRHGAYADVLFQAYHGQALACEVNPGNALLGRETFAEMAGLGPDVRFVLIMRDPVARLKSGIRHRLTNQHGADGLTEALLAEGLRDALAAGPRHLGFMRSRYDVTMTEMEAAVAPGRIGYFFYETFFTPGELARFTEFLGLPYRAARLDRVSHAGAGRSLEFPADLVAEAAALLAPTYAALRARFGAGLPAEWRAAPRTETALHPSDDDGPLKEL